jgi:hypothetical protein
MPVLTRQQAAAQAAAQAPQQPAAGAAPQAGVHGQTGHAQDDQTAANAATTNDFVNDCLVSGGHGAVWTPFKCTQHELLYDTCHNGLSASRSLQALLACAELRQGSGQQVVQQAGQTVNYHGVLQPSQVIQQPAAGIAMC